MDERVVEADYVVVGAGATAMAFTDVILTESDRTVVMVDQHAQPGGHWNHAYSFVRLHQPSAYYGVCSRPLGRHVRDTTGWNQGLYEQATGQQVLSYFDDVMREQFLPSSRVTYLPMSEYQWDGVATSSVTGQRTRLVARRKVVDAQYIGSEVPSQHVPSFEVRDGATLLPISALPDLTRAPAGYVILGAGKTSMDACLWLLEQGVDPARIAWVRPRDLWLLNRARVQPDVGQVAAFADMLEASALADSVDDLVSRLAATEVLLRIDDQQWPTTFRGATAAPREIEELRRVETVVRRGHVTSIEADVAHLEGGDLAVEPGWIYVDCTAEGLRRRPTVSVFGPERITLQYTMFFGVPTYSAALTARVEVAHDDDDVKNAACPALSVPNELHGIAEHILARLEAPARWSSLAGVHAWNDAARLNPASWATTAIDPADEQARAALTRIFEFAQRAEDNLRRLV